MKEFNIVRYQKKQISSILINWHSLNRRQFPWRDDNSPYNIMLAEKLLQQTLVSKNVVKAYNDIIKTYPDIHSLSEADENELVGYIKKLGLFYRAKELIAIGQTVWQKYQGKIPKDFMQLKSIPGIGNYIANAILCFAYNESVALVDANIARIFHRLFDLGEKLPENPARKKYLIQIARWLLPLKKVWVFNYALIDFGALICKYSNPKCMNCPLKHICSSGVMKGERNVR